ncbi:hypothetical protein FIV40_22240 [Pseudomonas marginalis]|nr:hypothetical protein FIV40_22240 [Pseudomonas marginalis]
MKPYWSSPDWPESKSCEDPLWEGACPRWRCVSHCIWWLTHCHRGQAPSHIKVPVFDGLRVVLGFFLQDFGLCMNLSRAARAPSLRPVIAKNGDTDVQVRRNCLGVQTPCQPTGVFCARCFMAAARRRSSDLLGVLNRPGLAHLRTVATLIRVQANGGAPY